MMIDDVYNEFGCIDTHRQSNGQGKDKEKKGRAGKKSN